MKTIKAFPVTCMLLLITAMAPAQNVKPCDEWLTGFIQVSPKMSDGSGIDKYVATQLQSETLLKNSATCMVGLLVHVNCRGEFSYEKMSYSNNSSLHAQCDDLLKATETIMKGIKTLSPGTIDGNKKDFTFKLLVRVKRNGKPVTEVLY